MHILGIFHPALKTLEQRESYIADLRRVYDSLKVMLVYGNEFSLFYFHPLPRPQGKLNSEVLSSPQVQHLRESIQRDAVRTDPTERFLALQANMQILVEIVTVYTLEHSEIKYTQVS